MPKTEFRRERRIWWSVVSKVAERSNERRTEMLSLSRVERISYYRTVLCITEGLCGIYMTGLLCITEGLQGV